MGFTNTTDKIFWLKEKSRLRHEIKWDMLSADMLSNISKFLSSVDKIKTYSLRALLDVHYSHPTDFVEQTRVYFDKNSTFEQRTKARFGEDHWNKKIAGAASRATTRGSTFTIEYWTNKGYSVDDAKAQVSKIQSENGKRSWQKNRSNIITNAYSIEYWTNKGYSVDEAQSRITELIFRTGGSLSRYIEKYGREIGETKHKERYSKQQATRKDRYGVANIPGKASKESIRIFLPLYKKLRKLGIKKQDIYWGVSGSKEFATCANGRNFFYDFTIKSLKVVVEYHGLFWHPRSPGEWKNNHFYEYDSKKLYDEIKKNAIIDRGFNYIVVWSDDDPQQSIDMILNKIKDKLNEDRK